MSYMLTVVLVTLMTGGDISVPLVLLRLTAVRKEYSHNSRLGQIDNEKKLVVDACMTYTPACPNEIRMLSERKNPIL